MTPAQRLAEWKRDGVPPRMFTRWFSTSRRKFVVQLDSDKGAIEGTGDTEDAAITAALDAWQKGDG